MIGKDLPEPIVNLTIKYYLIKDANVNSSSKFRKGEKIRITYLSRTTTCTIKHVRKRILTLELDDPLCIVHNCDKLSIAREVQGHNRLAGVGRIQNIEMQTATNKFDVKFGHQLPSYETLLGDIMTICVEKSKKRNTIKLTPPKCHKQGGARTLWTNFNTIVKQLGHPIEHFKQYATAEIGTTTSLTVKNELLLYGSYRPQNFEYVIRSYLRRYCKCEKCGNYDVELEITKNYDNITCRWCGNSKIINSITKDNSRKGKGGKLKI